MRKFKLILIIIILLLAAGAVWYFFIKKEEKPVVLLTEKPQYGYISKSVTATGTIQPVDTVSVGSQVSGTIKAIYTDFNAKVKKGQLIAELDKSLFEAQVNQFSANLEVAKSTLTYQKSNFDRQTLLFNSGAISKADFENAQNLYNTAKANVSSVQAQLDAAEKNLSYASIYSPVDGVVMTRNISVGQTVAASFSTPTLFVIAKDITDMQVQAAVSEADIGDVKIGLRVTFTVDAYPDITFTGTVKQIRLEPVVTANVVTYSTIISAPNEDLKLKPGMTANIFIYTKEIDNALLISAKDLKFTPDASMEKQFIIVPAQTGGHGQNGGDSGENGGGQGGNPGSGQGTTARGTGGQGTGAGQGNGQGGGGQSAGQRGAGTKGAGMGAESQTGAHSHSADSSRHRHHDTTAGQEIDTSARAQRASVWVKVGDSLIERRIRVGLNDDTHAQVLRGLTTDDDVVTGVQIQMAPATTGSTPARSPFMPARRGGGGNRGGSGGGSRPAGGTGGGGGSRPSGGGR